MDRQCAPIPRLLPAVFGAPLLVSLFVGAFWCCGLFVGLLLPMNAVAQEPEPEPKVEQAWSLELLTMAPGSQVHAHWGHTGLRIQSAAGLDKAYDYGRFDYSVAFFVKYFVGQPYYWLGRRNFQSTVEIYSELERAIWAQKITADNETAERLMELLDVLKEPGKREFPYDSLLNNCTTMMRDVLDKEVFGGALRSATEQLPSGRSYRDISNNHLRENPVTRWGVNLIYGSFGDHQLSIWETMYAPIELLRTLEQVRTGEIEADLPPGVALGPVELRTKFDTPFDDVVYDSGLRYLLVAAAAFLLLFFLPMIYVDSMAAARLHRLGLWLFALFAFVVGTVMLLFAFGPSPDYQNNLNLAAFHPALVLLPWVSSRAESRSGSQAAWWVLLSLLALPSLGLTLGTVLTGQSSLPYLLPAWLVVSAVVVRTARLRARP